MRIGITAATSFEIEPTINFLSANSDKFPDRQFEVLITGIGGIATTYETANFIRSRSPQLMIQAGIGGAFSDDLRLGDTVIINDEVLADLGVEENNLFSDLFDMGFMERNGFPFSNGRLLNPDIKKWVHTGLPAVSGVSVNEITTHANRITVLREKYSCEIESMEGAAFHYVCLKEQIPFLQLRTISNYVGERDKKKWLLKDAIINLNKALINIIQQIP